MQPMNPSLIQASVRLRAVSDKTSTKESQTDARATENGAKGAKNGTSECKPHMVPNQTESSESEAKTASKSTTTEGSLPLLAH